MRVRHRTDGRGGEKQALKSRKHASHRQADSGQAAPLARRGIRWHRWLVCFVAIYAIASSILASIRYANFRYDTWDLSVFRQALWSTTRGRILFEAGDHELFGVQSFFQIHPSFMMFPLAGLYALAPSPFTLLILQSLLTALAAIPLFYLTRDITNSDRKALLTAGLYLLWAPILSSNLYDFHLESFLPLELFTFFLLWTRARYAEGFLVAILAFLTLELTPLFILAFLVFLYFDQGITLLQRIWLTLRRSRASPSKPSPSTASPESGPSESLSLKWGIALGLAAVLAYLVLRLLEGPYLFLILGYTPAYHPTFGLSTGSLGLNLSYFTADLSMKLEYWVLLYALLAFIPLVRPRTLILVAPWLVFTFFTAFTDYYQFGYQYGYVVAAPLLIGFAYGLSHLQFAPPKELRSALLRRGPRPSPAVAVTGILVAVIAANVLLSPVNPAIQYPYTSVIGLPGGSNYLYQTYSPNLYGYDNLVRLTSLVPTGSTVLASDDLFNLVTNNVNAYTTLWYPSPPQHLPFNRTHLPDYVLLSGDQLPEMPSFVLPFLYNQSVYGVRGTLAESPVGPVLLFQRDYHGPSANYAPLPVKPGIYNSSTLSVGYAQVVNDSSARFNRSIVSTPPQNGTPLLYSIIWFGPYALLQAGNYSVSLSVRATPVLGANVSTTTPVLFLEVDGFATRLLFNESLTFGELNSSGWTNVTFSLSLPSLTLDTQVRGYLLCPLAQVWLNYLEIAPIMTRGAV